MNPYKVFLKHTFGAKYEGIKKSLLVAGIIFCAIFAAEIRMRIAPTVLFLTATFFTMGVMWQALGSKKNTENLQGLLVLPFENRQLVWGYALAMSTYTLLSKTALVLALFFAVGSFRMGEIALALLCACVGCLFALTGFLLRKKPMVIVVFLGMGCYLATLFCVKETVVFAGVALACLLGGAVYLLKTDAYEFYHPIVAKTVCNQNKKKGSFFVYLIRYLLANKNYMVNTAGLCIIACVLPMILNQLGDFNALPMGLAILSLNTPLCILLSVDRDLEQAVRMLPGQGKRFCAKYCTFLAMVNMIISIIFLASWQLQYGGIGAMVLVTAGVFALQSAVCSVALEWFYPLRSWKLESDLYHHPRKYIVPGILLLLAGLVSLWWGIVWILLCILVLELFCYFFIKF